MLMRGGTLLRPDGALPQREIPTRSTAAASALLAAAMTFTPVAVAGQDGPLQVVTSEPILEIGDVLGESPDFFFTSIASIAVIGDSILVLDDDLNELRVFDHEGAFVGRIGGPGEGPGEFSWPTQLVVVSEGIAVVDLRLRRTSFFSLSGSLLRTEPLGQLPTQALAGWAPLRGQFRLAETTVSIGSETGAFPERLVVLLHPNDARVDTVARYSTGYVPYRLPDSYGFLTVRAGSEGDWAVVGDSLVAVVSGEPPTLRWWRAATDGPILAGEVELPIEPEPFTRDDTRGFIDKENERRSGEGAPLLPRSVELEIPNYWGQVRNLVISDHHECWVQFDAPRAEDYGDWFRVELPSRRLTRVRLPTGFRLLAATGGRLYGYVLTEFDAPVLRVYTTPSAERGLGGGTS